MLERQHGEIIFVCDGCQESLVTGTGDFDNALAVLKDSNGWKIRRRGGEWEHYCPDCNTDRAFIGFEPA